MNNEDIEINKYTCTSTNQYTNQFCRFCMEHIGTQLKRHIKSVILDILVTNMTNHFTDKMSWKGMSSQNIDFLVCVKTVANHIIDKMS